MNHTLVLLNILCFVSLLLSLLSLSWYFLLGVANRDKLQKRNASIIGHTAFVLWALYLGLDHYLTVDKPAGNMELRYYITLGIATPVSICFYHVLRRLRENI